ncbi:MAG: type II secretion system F family protein [Syntrophobacterales bacterium]|nr:type II secretion system F family protein [Syntrophobacterales bacterium]
MPEYIWTGFNRRGDRVSGMLEGVNEAAIEQILTRQGIKILKIKPRPKHISEYLPFLSPRVKLSEMVVFSRQFATMVNAGVPIVQTLDILRDQTGNITFKKTLREIREAVKAGQTLSEAFSQHPKIFDEFIINLTRAGETSGALDVIMNRIAEYLEKLMALKRKIKGAMVYPIAVISFAVVVVMVMLVYVIPIFARMFQDAGLALPLPTLVVINISKILRDYIHWIFLGLVLAGFILFRIRKTERGRLVTDSIMLRIPVLGELIRKSSIARVCRTLSTLIENGVPILDSLQIVARVAGNRVIERTITYAREEVSRGRGLSDPIEETRVFPLIVSKMIAVGETTGALNEMLGKIADFFEDEVDRTVEALTSLLEPLFIIVLGLIIGGLLIAMYLPIFQIGQVVGGGGG